MSYKKTTDNRPTRIGEVYQLTLDQIVVATHEDGRKVNNRIDFGDIPEFGEEIYASGKILNPLHGFKKDGKFHVTEGERRTLSVAYINKKYGIDFPIPFMCEPKGTTTIHRLYKQRIMNNSSKAFTPVEDAALVMELINQGQTEKEICAQLKFTNVYISNLKTLHNAPEQIKQFILKGTLSSTEAMRILRKDKDYESAIKTIQDTLSFVQATKGTNKVTARDVEKAKGAVNSFSAIKKAFKMAPKRVVRQDNIDLFNQLKKIVDGEITLEWLISELYEPEVTDKVKESSMQMQIE
jgi:hypothetical protein